jgi:hypothetical protein
MSDEKRTTETTEVTTETSGHSGSPVRDDSTYRKETIVSTERKVEKDDAPIIIVQNK